MFFARNPSPNTVVSTGFAVLRSRESEIAPRFLYALVLDRAFTDYLVTREQGAAYPAISHHDIFEAEVALPPLCEQRRIARILGAFDDKIELNRRMCATLEEMARAIFRSWFVDFDPVRAKVAAIAEGRDPERAAMAAISGKKDEDLDTLPPETLASLRATAALFPSRFTDSELGEIPEGWIVRKVGSILELAYGKSLSKQVRVPGDVPVYGSGGVDGYHNEALASGPGIVVGRKGSVGTVHWVARDFFPIDTVFYVKPGNGYQMRWCYELLRTLNVPEMGADSAVPGVNRNTVYAKLISTPPPTLLRTYDDLVAPMVALQHELVKQSDTLAALRDMLLPKLLSGELAV